MGFVKMVRFEILDWKSWEIETYDTDDNGEVDIHTIQLTIKIDNDIKKLCCLRTYYNDTENDEFDFGFFDDNEKLGLKSKFVKEWLTDDHTLWWKLLKLFEKIDEETECGYFDVYEIDDSVVGLKFLI